MTYRRTSVLKELRRIKRATADPYDRRILKQAEDCVKYAVAESSRQDDVTELERLYRLEDPRS